MVHSLDMTIDVSSTLTKLSEVHFKLSENYKKLTNTVKYDKVKVSKSISSLDRKRVRLMGELEMYEKFINEEIYQLNGEEQVKYFAKLLEEIKKSRKGVKGNDRLLLDGKVKAIKEDLAWAIYTNDLYGKEE